MSCLSCRILSLLAAQDETFEENTVQVVAGLGTLRLLVESQLLIVSFLVGLFSGDSLLISIALEGGLEQHVSWLCSLLSISRNPNVTWNSLVIGLHHHQFGSCSKQKGVQKCSFLRNLPPGFLGQWVTPPWWPSVSHTV